MIEDQDRCEWVNRECFFWYWLSRVVLDKIERSINGCVCVCIGGYDRGECLITVESFDLASNIWSSLKPMLVARGRFAIAEMNGYLYACGGSNGQMDLCSAEWYDPHTDTWTLLPDMSIQRSYAGSFQHFTNVAIKAFPFTISLFPKQCQQFGYVIFR